MEDFSSPATDDRWRGVYGVLTTPFNRDYSIDWAGLRANIDHAASSSIDVLVALGSGGEFYALSDRERRQVVECITEQLGGRRPLVVGVSHPSSIESSALAKHAASNGTHAVMSTAPYYLGGSPEILRRHLATIAEAGLPLFYYNVPQRVGYAPPPGELLALARDIPLAGVKQSATDIADLVGLLGPHGPRWLVLGGNEVTMWPALCVGAQGNTATAAVAVPQVFADLWHASEARDMHAGDALHARLGPLRTAYQLGGGQVPVVKRLLELRGLAGGPPRPPLQAPGPEVDVLLEQV